ncbi:hypothetical protein [Actinoplanes sp. NPDC089786]|uniref:hypothetical protein n=1 Tax=Actinoplanes sp. NPDC089786 TaxID=3155185 RepID=UPI00342C3298
MPIDYPVDADGRRSSLAFGRAVVADALRAADPAAAAAAERETDWRKGYVKHFIRLTALASPEVAAAGLASVHRRIETPDLAGPELTPETITGSGTPEREVTLPYRGQLLRGEALDRRLDAWVSAGIIEPSCAAAVREVVANPDWLDLAGRTLVVLGAGAEMGPLPAWLGWGGTVIGVDLPPARCTHDWPWPSTPWANTCGSGATTSPWPAWPPRPTPSRCRPTRWPRAGPGGSGGRRAPGSATSSWPAAA